ncbi:MAG: sensor histidine kinase [Akkermansiaceae bacterium]|nr:sensor histidine kinase [Akkermansiaceae bacterium]
MARRKTSSSPAWLLPVVLLPLLWLVFLAWQGTRNEVRTISYLQKDAADQFARQVAGQLVELTRHPRVIPKFPDPPRPGEPSPLDDVLDGHDVAALTELGSNGNAGLTPAGLPRQVLAVLRLRGGAAGPATEDLISLLTQRQPSVLTGRALAGLDYQRDEQMAWADLERLRPLVERDPNLGWVCENNGRCCWLKSDDGHWLYVSRDKVRDVMRTARMGSEDFIARLSTSTDDQGGEGVYKQLTYLPVQGGNGLRVEVFATGSGHFEEMTGQSRRWGSLTLGGAVAVTILGLYLMHRTLTRERKLSEMKSQFVASVSHELRSPVASIRLMAEALDAGKVDDATAANFHRLIAREGARLSTLVGNVLDHARIEQGRRIWKIEPCNLAGLVTDTTRVMEPLAKEKDITLTVTTLPIDSAVDAGAIQQALVNLLDNAIKFSPPGSGVRVVMANHEKSRTWELAVADQGSGIPRKEQSRIFERFYRPGDELRRETQGTGIGLSLVKAIAEAHGGSVRVDSEPGLGSTFTLRFPLA